MGLFSKVTGGSASQVSKQRAAREKTLKGRSDQPNVLHNPNAYLAYGGDGVDRGAMMAQQAATRTHQQAMDAIKQRQVREEQMPKPRTSLPTPKESQKNQVDMDEAGKVADKINFLAFNKVTRVYHSQILEPEWIHAFTPFGFDHWTMLGLDDQWKHGLGEVKATLVKSYKKESKITQNGWEGAKIRNAGAAGRYATRNCRYNGITVSVRGGYDTDKQEPYFDFIVPTNKQEFISWRKQLMDEFNPKRAARGFQLINMEGTHDYEDYLDFEVSVPQQ